MNITRWRRNDVYDPMRDLERIQSEINKLFDIEPSDGVSGLFDTSFSPAVDIVEHEDRYEVECDLPGVSKDDIELSVAGNVLTIKGEKKGETKRENGGYFRKETWSGSFQRSLALPQSADGDKIDASLRDGVLRISLPKREEMKPKRISVSVA